MEWSFLFFLNSALLGVGLAMDAFSVSMANGLHDPGMSRKRMCIIAGTFGVFQAVMPMTGWVCVHTIVEMFSSFETFIPWIALALLGYIGGKMLIDGIRGEETEEAAALSAGAEEIDYNKLYEADRLLHETWFAAMGKMYLWRTLQNAHADYSRFRMLDTMTSGGLDEVIADHQNIITAIERCDLAAFEPLVERHLYGGIRRLGSKLTEEYADYFEPEK